MKRRLVSFGIFAPARCNGALVRDARMVELYRALKSAGFVETRWQYIFEDQIGGLVCPCNGGLNEVHVRFYPDRIFAEFEVSRSSPMHFVYPLFNANKYVADLLRDMVSPEALEYLRAQTTSNLKDDERSQPDWEPMVRPDPYQSASQPGSSFASRLGVICHPYMGWRGIVVCAIVIAVPLSIQVWPPMAVFLSLLAILAWRAVPTAGRP